MKTYLVTYRRDPEDDTWLVEVGGLPDVCMFGRTVDKAAVNAREAIAVTMNVEVSAVRFEEHFAAAAAGQ